MTPTRKHNSSGPSRHSCDNPEKGYTCEPKISRYWGQYSPYYSVASDINRDVPNDCKITFAQALYRHGARGPTSNKIVGYNSTITKLQASFDDPFEGIYAFLNEYEFTLEPDQLTPFGEQQLVNAGRHFYKRYDHLVGSHSPFVRASGQERVVASARKWISGYKHAGHQNWKSAQLGKPSNPIVVIPEEPGVNNSLNHGVCDAHESGVYSTLGDDAQLQWRNEFVPHIQKRLNQDLPRADLNESDVINLMQLCPFETVNDKDGKPSQFCELFTETEWRQLDYYETLGKYYGWGAGNPLGPTIGVGFANELISRLTGRELNDSTSTNADLDSSRDTFPTGKNSVLFADFSHDNPMTSIFFALNLYSTTASLSNTSMETSEDLKKFSASRVVPFAARAYIEKMQCGKSAKEFVRVLVNDRVVPLPKCEEKGRPGRCKLDAFVKSLSFAQEGGKWEQCFE